MLVDVIEAGVSGGFLMDDCPIGWDVGKGGPQRVPAFGIDRSEEIAAFVVEWMFHNLRWLSLSNIYWFF